MPSYRFNPLPLFKYWRSQSKTDKRGISSRIFFLSASARLFVVLITGLQLKNLVWQKKSGLLNYTNPNKFTCYPFSSGRRLGRGDSNNNLLGLVWLGLEHGIPSHDTFGEVYAAIDTDQFSVCFSRWVADLANITEGEVIAIDGKCLRRSIDKASKKAAIYRVSAWAQQNNLVLGQVKVDDKSNEITAIPKLLSRLDIAGAVITIDAMGRLKRLLLVSKENSQTD